MSQGTCLQLWGSSEMRGRDVLTFSFFNRNFFISSTRYAWYSLGERKSHLFNEKCRWKGKNRWNLANPCIKCSNFSFPVHFPCTRAKSVQGASKPCKSRETVTKWTHCVNVRMQWSVLRVVSAAVNNWYYIAAECPVEFFRYIIGAKGILKRKVKFVSFQ